MKAINFPVLPPIFPSEFPRPLTAPLMAGPAVEVTRDSPSEAFDLYSEAVCEAFEAVSFVASVALPVVDSNLRADRPGSLVDCRSTLREMANDISKSMRTRRPKKMTLSMLETLVGEQLVLGVIVQDCLQFSPAAGKKESRL